MDYDNTVGVLTRNGKVVGSLTGLTGSVKRGTLAMRAQLTGRPTYYCRPGYDLFLTWIIRPDHPRSGRIGMTVRVASIDGENLRLTGQEAPRVKDLYTGAMPHFGG